MKIKIQIVVESDNGDAQVTQEIMQISRGALQPENLGLKLAEAKTLLQSLQRTLAEQQIAEYSLQQESCLHCSKKLLHKDKRTMKAVPEIGRNCPDLIYRWYWEWMADMFVPTTKNRFPKVILKSLLGRV